MKGDLKKLILVPIAAQILTKEVGYVPVMCIVKGELVYTTCVYTSKLCLDMFSHVIGQNIETEDKLTLVNEDGSPPISEKLREISNNLKLLCFASPIKTIPPERNDASSSALVPFDTTEPKTPVIDPSTTENNRWEAPNVNSPWGTFSMCSSRAKVWSYRSLYAE